MNPTQIRSFFSAYRRADAEQTPASVAAYLDQCLRTACAGMPLPQGALLLAVGGYGRGELYPFSDVDLLVSLPAPLSTTPATEDVQEATSAVLEQIAEHLFLPLWDAGLELGHGIRTMAESMELAAQDVEVACSLLDARLLWGADDGWSEFCAGVDAVLRARHAEMVRALWERHLVRHDSATLIAPNLKNGRGGLRDAQTMLWLQSVLARCGLAGGMALEADEQAELATQTAFVQQARLALHRVSGRKNDILHLELQPEVAALMGFDVTDPVRGTETFLSRLHQAMHHIGLVCRFWCARIMADVARTSGQDAALADAGVDFSLLAANPAYVVELFAQSARLGRPLSWPCQRLIGQQMVTLRTRTDWQREITPRVSAALCSPEAGAVLARMLETGFLRAYVPEFAAVEHFVQFDAYHVHPVGAHVVETMRELTRFPQDSEFLQEYLGAVHDDPCVRWAALLHDIGKGGEAHEERGAYLTDAILARLGCADEVRVCCVELVRDHLLLVHTATRQDLSADAVIQSLASHVGSVRRLDMLTLLAWADSRATGPKAWTPWIQNLLRELYFKTRRALEKTFQDDHAMHRLSTIRDGLRVLRPDEIGVVEFEQFLGRMPARYLLQTSSEDIVAHVLQVRRFQHQAAGALLEWWHKPEARSFRLTLVAADQPGLFARVCAALCIHGFSVYAADLGVWDDGTVVDVFWVSEPPDMLYAEEACAALSRTLDALLRTEAWCAAETPRLPASQKRLFALDRELVRVRAENDSADGRTTLHIEAPDIKGLLATISCALFQLELDVSFAKIATQKDKAMDVFHVRQHGAPIPDAELTGLENTVRLLLGSLYV